MKNYELLNDDKIKYLSYICNHIKTLEDKIDFYFKSNRNAKLELLVGDDDIKLMLLKIKEDICGNIEKIKNRCNNIDINNIASVDVSNIEKIAIDVDQLHKYFEYVVNKIDILHEGGNQTS